MHQGHREGVVPGIQRLETLVQRFEQLQGAEFPYRQMQARLMTASGRQIALGRALFAAHVQAIPHDDCK